MNWSTIESGWDKTLGKREELASQVQQAYGVSKEDAERQISEWQSLR